MFSKLIFLQAAVKAFKKNKHAAPTGVLLTRWLQGETLELIALKKKYSANKKRKNDDTSTGLEEPETPSEATKTVEDFTPVGRGGRRVIPNNSSSSFS